MGDVTTLPARRRLTDLWVIGKELVINDDDSQDPVTVWVSKLVPAEEAEVRQRATAARSKILLKRQLQESDPEYVEEVTDIEGFDNRDGWIEFLSAEKKHQIELSQEAELASEKPWSENGYYDGLRESWDTEMKLRYMTDPEGDAEALEVYNALKPFADELNRRTEKEIEALKRDFDNEDDASLRRKVTDRLLEASADYAWYIESKKWELFYAIREPDDHKRKYFVSKEEIDYLDNRVVQRLLEAYTSLLVDSTEGKD